MKLCIVFRDPKHKIEFVTGQKYSVFTVFHWNALSDCIIVRHRPMLRVISLPLPWHRPSLLRSFLGLRRICSTDSIPIRDCWCQPEVSLQIHGLFVGFVMIITFYCFYFFSLIFCLVPCSRQSSLLVSVCAAYCVIEYRVIYNWSD